MVITKDSLPKAVTLSPHDYETLLFIGQLQDKKRSLKLKKPLSRDLTSHELQVIYRTAQLKLLYLVMQAEDCWQSVAEVQRPKHPDYYVHYHHRDRETLAFLIQRAISDWPSLPVEDRYMFIARCLQDMAATSINTATSPMLSGGGRGVENPRHRLKWWSQAVTATERNHLIKSLALAQNQGSQTLFSPEAGDRMFLDTSASLKIAISEDGLSSLLPIEEQFPQALYSSTTFDQIILRADGTVLMVKNCYEPRLTPEAVSDEPSYVQLVVQMALAERLAQKLYQQAFPKPTSTPPYFLVDPLELAYQPAVKVIERYPLILDTKRKIWERDVTPNPQQFADGVNQLYQLSAYASNPYLLALLKDRRKNAHIPTEFWPRYQVPQWEDRNQYFRQLGLPNFIE